jgi:hypothetical protein
VRPERDADPSPPSSAEVKSRVELYLYSSLRAFGAYDRMKSAYEWMTEEIEDDFGHGQELSCSQQSPDQLLDLAGQIHQIPGVSSRGKAAEELNTPLTHF